MKRTVITLLAAVALAVSFSACEHQTMRTAEVTIQPYEWVTNNNVNYYFATVRWDELTPEVVDYGLVNAYMVNQSGIQDVLPLVTPVTYYNLDFDGDGVVDYDSYTIAENIRFDIRYGEITFIIQDQDGGLPLDMESTLPMTFRIVALGD